MPAFVAFGSPSLDPCCPAFDPAAVPAPESNSACMLGGANGDRCVQAVGLGASDEQRVERVDAVDPFTGDRSRQAPWASRFPHPRVVFCRLLPHMVWMLCLNLWV